MTSAQGLIGVEVPLDLRRTLAPLGGHFLDDGWWRTARTPEGSGTLRLAAGPGGVEARAWGSGGEWLLSHVPELLGLADDPEGLVTDHPVVAPLARRMRGARFGATRLVFEGLLTAVVAQKVTFGEANRGMAGLRSRFSEPAPGPQTLPLPPDPARMAASPYWDYHPLGIEKKRADTLRRIAEAASRIEQLGGVGAEQARRALHRYRGVGVWTSAETVAVTHGDADAVSVGDFHLKNVVAWHLTGKPRGTDEEMLQLLEPFRPHRGRVVRLLATLGRAPAFGPRQPVRSISRI